MDDSESSNELSISEIAKIAQNFRNLHQLTLSGGEPTLREDLVDIVAEFSRKKPIPRLTLPSNGQNPQLLEKIVVDLTEKFPLTNINVALSLDGTKDVHDNIRGVAGAFEKHLESRKAIDKVRKKYSNVSLVIATTISSYNIENMDELLEYIKEDPAPDIYGFMLARGVTREEEARAFSTDDFLQYASRLHDIQQSFLGKSSLAEYAVREQYYRNRIKTIESDYMVDPCKAGSKLLVLNHEGDLWPCEMLMGGEALGYPLLDGGWKFGNFREVDYSLSRLLNSSQAKKIKDYIINRKCQCTFECALINNYALNYCNLPKVGLHFLRRLFS